MPVPPEVYDRAYFLSETCEGIDEFRAGLGLSPLKARQVRMAAPSPGRRVLDAGCGRGEVLLACARAGAEVAGIDYSADAVAITAETLAGVAGADVRRGDVTALPWADRSFDVAVSGDVLEHLEPADGARMLAELHRVLRPGGRLVLHTAPNRLFLAAAWPAGRLVLRAAGHGESVRRLDAWIAASGRYHLNEQTLHGLRRSVRRAGFAAPHAWIDPNLVRDGTHHTTAGLERSALMALGQRLARWRPVRLVCGNDLWVVAHRV